MHGLMFLEYAASILQALKKSDTTVGYIITEKSADFQDGFPVFQALRKMFHNHSKMPVGSEQTAHGIRHCSHPKKATGQVYPHSLSAPQNKALVRPPDTEVLLRSRLCSNSVKALRI